MTEANDRDSSILNNFTDVTLVCGDEPQISDHRVMVGSSINAEDLKIALISHEINSRENKPSVPVIDENVKSTTSEEVTKIKVNYSLNKIKNLDVAKVNAVRPIKLARLVTDDLNLRYELNSGQYLHIKAEVMKFSKTETETSDDGKVTITVVKNSAVEDRDENNPETQVKMSVINNVTKENTNVVIKMYHTNQSIHLQGGKRMGMVTSTSLLADFLEKRWHIIMKDNVESIKEANEKIKNLVLNTGVATRARTSTSDQTLSCEHCSYQCSLKHQLNTHKISKHGVTVKPLKITSSKRKSPPSRSPDNTRKPAKGILKSNVKYNKTLPKPRLDVTVKNYPCPVCGFVYNSKSDMDSHMTGMHAKEEGAILQQCGKITEAPAIAPKVDVPTIEEITTKEVKTNEKEEFLDREKEKLYEEAENWRKTAQDLDMDLKSALKANEKLIKEQLGVKEDYEKVAKVAGELQAKVHTLEEEVKEMKIKTELDIKAKDVAEIKLEELKADLDSEGIPKCPICTKWFPNIEIIH